MKGSMKTTSSPLTKIFWTTPMRKEMIQQTPPLKSKKPPIQVLPKKNHLRLINSKPTRRILRYRTPTKRTESEIIRFWKTYGVELVQAMSKKITPDNIKLEFATWTDKDVDKLTYLINKSF